MSAALHRPLQDVLADWRGNAAVLRKHGSEAVARALETCADEVAQAAEEYLLFLEEDEAVLRTGRKRSWLRGHFAAWQAEGHAYLNHGRRYYRALLLPRRVHRELAIAEGRRLGQGATP